MLISFQELPEDSRIWIYQADRSLEEREKVMIGEELDKFIATWAAHNQPLRGSYQLLYDRFLIIGLDESFNPVTGCSTDASVNMIRSLGNKLGVDFFDRMKLPVLMDDETVELIGLDKFRNKQLPGYVTPGARTFNNLIQQKGQLEAGWIQPIEKTWLAKYL